MSHPATTVPLLFRLDLTAEQQQQIRDRTGVALAALPYASSAAALRIRFGGVPLRVPRGVFVPSAATERLLSLAVSSAATWPRPIVIDVGTGCGAVALATARALPAAMVYATDISTMALDAARRNRARLGLHNVRFLHGSLLAPLPMRLHGRVSTIVANVPYVPPDLDEALASAFPVGSAIGVGADGLGLVRELAASARRFLAPGGSLVLQLADFQWPVIGNELAAFGYRTTELPESAERGPLAGRFIWTPDDAPHPRSGVHDHRAVDHARFTITQHSPVAAFTLHPEARHGTPE